ncbi:DUF6801 domain-containing protein [Pueribacillus sp. YX66]|uniref:DUF6801 domain-containing protein n=1 Tax=Pueribacillus sp. YX66 TaxID=3229242 RepID=UPI00358CE95A
MLKKVSKSFISLAVTVFLLASLTAFTSAQEQPINTISYNCDAVVKLFGAPIENRNFDIQVAVFGDAPDEVDAGDVISVENSYAKVTVPSSVVLDLDNILGWNNISGSVNKFEIISDNVQQVINVAPQSIAKTPIPKDGSDFEFRVPATSELIVGPFTAGNSGVINVSAGDIEAVFQNGDGLGIFTLEADCQPSGNPIIKTVTINSNEN